MRTPTFSIEVITLPVSVDRAMRFYVDQVGFTLDVDYSPNDSFRVVQLTPPGSTCSIQIGQGLTDAPAGSVRNIYLSSWISKPHEVACSNVEFPSARSGARRQLEPGMEISNAGSIPLAGIMPASPTSPIPMATAGSYKNEATAFLL